MNDALNSNVTRTREQVSICLRQQPAPGRVSHAIQVEYIGITRLHAARASFPRCVLDQEVCVAG